MNTEPFFVPIKTLKSVINLIGLRRDGKQSKFYSIIGYLNYLLLNMCLNLVQINHLVDKTDWQEKMVNMSLAATVFSVSFKVHMCLKCVNSFHSLEQNLRKLFEVSEDLRVRTIMKNKLKIITRIMQVYAVIMIVNALVGFIVAFAFGRLPFKARYPFNTKEWSVGFYVAAFHGNFACIFGESVHYFSSIYPMIFIIYATGVIDGLALRLSQIGLKSKQKEYDELKKIIEVHQMVRIYVEEIQKCFKIAFFFQCSVMSLILGLTVFTLSYVKEFSIFILTISYCMPMMSEIFLPCYLCNELTLSSENLISSIVHSEWINMDKKTKKILSIFLENLKKPLKITFHELMDINLLTFTNILQSAYSLYAVLKQINS